MGSVLGSETTGSGAKTAKVGRKVGSPKTGGSGCRKPPAGLKPPELRRWMIENTRVIENLLKMADGLPVMMRGPHGKQHYHYADAAEMRWAMGQVLSRILPTMGSVQLSGDADGAAIRLDARDNTGLGGDAELGRRLALLQAVVDRPQEPQEPPTTGRPMTGTSDGVNGTQRVLEAPAEPINGTCTPAIGAVVVVDSDRGVTLTRMSDDGKQDHGGEWRVEQHGKQVKLLKAITAEAAAQVVQAMDAERAFDDS